MKASETPNKTAPQLMSIILSQNNSLDFSQFRVQIKHSNIALNNHSTLEFRSISDNAYNLQALGQHAMMFLLLVQLWALNSDCIAAVPGVTLMAEQELKAC